MEYFLTSITVPWTVLRCLSFSVDFATDPESSKRRFPDFWMSLAYVFYLPSVCLGPLMNYDNFVAQLEQPRKPWTVGELVGGLMGLVRSAFHLVLRDLMNHYFYSPFRFAKPAEDRWIDVMGEGKKEQENDTLATALTPNWLLANARELGFQIRRRVYHWGPR
ncbi:protein-cysteine N-palmitoyltransferase HHAT [Ixodes scapularis]